MQHEIWTVKRVLQSSLDWLKTKDRDSSFNPKLDCELMLSSVLGVDRMRLYLELDRPLSREEREQFKTFLVQRGSGVPVAQIVGYRDFYRHRFVVTKDTLIPRPDTEILVETAIDSIKNIKSPKVLDIGTGTGCIAISIAAQFPEVVVEAWDLSEEALVVAQGNSKRLDVNNVSFLCCDALKAEAYDGRLFDVIVSNPPYVPWSERSLCSAETLNYEPHGALFASDADGLTFYRVFAEHAGKSLGSGGKIFLEVGLNQAEKVAQLFEAKGWRKIIMIKDLSGRNRVIAAQRP